MKLQKVIFFKSQTLLAKRAPWRPAIHSISMAGYVTAVPAFVSGELPAWEVSSFYDF